MEMFMVFAGHFGDLDKDSEALSGDVYVMGGGFSFSKRDSYISAFGSGNGVIRVVQP